MNQWKSGFGGVLNFETRQKKSSGNSSLSSSQLATREGGHLGFGGVDRIGSSKVPKSRNPKMEVFNGNGWHQHDVSLTNQVSCHYKKWLWGGEWLSFFMSLGLTTFRKYQNSKLRYIHCTTMFASSDTTKSSTFLFTRVIRHIPIAIWLGSKNVIVQSSSDYLKRRRRTSHKILPTKPVQHAPPPLIGVFLTLQFLMTISPFSAYAWNRKVHWSKMSRL